MSPEPTTANARIERIASELEATRALAHALELELDKTRAERYETQDARIRHLEIALSEHQQENERLRAELGRARAELARRDRE